MGLSDLQQDTLSETAAPESREKHGQPRVSVLVATYMGHQRIQRCLESLAAQTLAPSDFEIVVVQNGPPCPTPALVKRFGEAHPNLQIRVVEINAGGLGNARNVGLQAIRGEFVTYVDDDDWVSPRYLEALVQRTAPGVIPVAPIEDIAESGGHGSGTFDTYYSRIVLAHAGKVVSPPDLIPAMSINGGKLLPTDLARSLAYDTSLRSGEDWIYLLNLYSRRPFDFAVLGLDDGAIYHRVCRDGSLGRQDGGYDFMITQRLECMKAIEQIDTSDSRVAHLAKAFTAAQASRINSYLAAHPEDHPRVVADVVKIGVKRPRWRAINRGLARDLALLYLFPPRLDTSALVAARRLRERGLVTDVISQNLEGLRSHDSSSLAVANAVVGSHVVLDDDPGVPLTPAIFGSWQSVLSYVEKSMAAVDRIQAERGPYRSVYSRAMAVHSHYAAAILKLRQPEIRWIAEFSDPMRFDSNGLERAHIVGSGWLADEVREALSGAGVDLPAEIPLFSTAEYLAYALADEIVFTNQNQMDVMMNYCEYPQLKERARSRCRIEVHPTLPERFYHRMNAGQPATVGKVNIAYFGVFYRSRGLDVVLDAIRGLPLAVRDSMRLHVFVDDPEKFRATLIAEEVADVVVAHGFLGYLKFLNATTKFDVLLVNDAVTRDHHSVNPYLPSKLADYLGSGTPIWAIYEPGSVLSAIKTEYRSEVGDARGAAEVLRHIVSVGHKEVAR